MKKSLFNLSHEKLLTCDMGQLIPIAIYDVSPGDVIRGNTSLLVRTQPLLAPVMHKVDCSIHHFFVPLRLCWNSFEDFINGGLDGLQNPTYPTITWATAPQINSLADYLGLPVQTTTPAFNPAGMVTSALPFRAYGLIYNNWYADEQLNTLRTVSLADGADSTTDVTLANACWFKDYFTAARPEPQLGDDVTIPLTGDAPVYGTDESLQFRDGSNTIGSLQFNSASGALSAWNTVGLNVGATGSTTNPTGWTNAEGIGLAQSGDTGLEADMSGISAVGINDLRVASALQRFKEKMNRKGARYVEYLSSMFGVTAQDSRLQLPEYLGGGNVTIQFSEVLQTAEGTDPVGELRGHGIAAGRSNRFKYFAPEHGFVISLLTVRPKTVYSQGLNKLWSRSSRYDYLIPDFAHLGDQTVLKKEIYAAAAAPNDTFGYTPRYDDYRTIPNTISGEFRETLDFWHMAQIYDAEPALNDTFVTCTPTDRIYATDAAQLQIRAMHSIKCKRILPKQANPRLL